MFTFVFFIMLVTLTVLSLMFPHSYTHIYLHSFVPKLKRLIIEVVFSMYYIKAEFVCIFAFIMSKNVHYIID